MDESIFLQRKTLKEVSKEIFKDTAPTQVVEQSYLPDGQFVSDFPLSAQRHIWQAKEKFFRQNKDNFSLSISLSRSHGLDDQENLSDSALELIRPMFANAYLVHSGISNTEESIRMVTRLVPIHHENIEIRTKKKGFLDEQVIVEQNPIQRGILPHRENQVVAAKCDAIRQNLHSAWTSIERNFPRDVPRQTIKPFVPHKGTFMPPSSFERAPSSIPQDKECEGASPFIKVWILILTKEEVEATANEVVDDDLSVQDKEFFKNWLFYRLLYHMAKYCHSILVMDNEDTADFIRGRALWHFCYMRCQPKSPEFKHLPAIIAMAKACTSCIFSRNASEGAFSSIGEMEASLFAFIDSILDPFKLFVQKGKDEVYHVKLPKSRTSLDDITWLATHGKLEAEELQIARAMMSRSAPERIVNLLSGPWGDEETQIKESELTERDGISSLPAQQMIARDIEELDRMMPRKPPGWISSLHSKQT